MVKIVINNINILKRDIFKISSDIISSMQYITLDQYELIKDIPRGRLAARTLIFAGAIIEKDGMILMCSSKKSKYDGWQLPGGKVMWSETIVDCANREVLEEVGMDIKIDGILGIFQRDTGPEDEEYLRVIFTIKDFKKKNNYRLDPSISDIQWIEIQDILKGKVKLQSKQILKEVQRYTEGIKYPLEVLDMYRW